MTDLEHRQARIENGELQREINRHRAERDELRAALWQMSKSGICETRDAEIDRLTAERDALYAACWKIADLERQGALEGAIPDRVICGVIDAELAKIEEDK
tara:strand:- start:1281 stop:1583 length:303 start_codon:yes stop_codon:yes gene_type:complete